MRKLLLTLALGAMASSHVGCVLPAYSGDPVRRTRELIFTSEDMRQMMDEWERIWFLDMPSNLTPFRTYGGII
ncbi:MAG: hypothetical protein MPJ50_18900 [Pirellulales bacterium]|nr:hypothetical protein [Pirellulales bacterium]